MKYEILDPEWFTEEGLMFFQVGEIDPLELYVWASSWEAAIETVASWLKENEPSWLMNDLEMLEIYEDIAKDHGVSWKESDPGMQERIMAEAETDLYFTDEGVIFSDHVHFIDVYPDMPIYKKVLEESLRALDPDELSTITLDRAERMASKHDIDLEDIWPQLYE